MRLMFLLLFLSFESFAAGCHLFQLKGLVEDNNGLRIKIHEGTNSEKFFVFPKELELRMAAYLKRHVQGNFILKTKEPVSGAEIVGIEKTELAVPDPLFHHQEISYLKSVPCPLNNKKKKS